MGPSWKQKLIDIWNRVNEIWDRIWNGALTTYNIVTAGAQDANGVNWVTLYDSGVLTNEERVWGIILTIAGAWAGLCQFRITVGGTKIFPFAAQAEENTDFVSGIEWAFPAPVVIPAGGTYIIQFRSTNGADGAGKTCTLTELPVIDIG